jgi:hypothetical protein
MHLDDVDYVVFGLLVHWTYMQDIEDGQEAGLLPLRKLWMLSEGFPMPGLQNKAMNSFAN